MKKVEIDFKKEFVNIMKQIEGAPDYFIFPVFVNIYVKEPPYLYLKTFFTKDDDIDLEELIYNKNFIGVVCGWNFDEVMELLSKYDIPKEFSSRELLKKLYLETSTTDKSVIKFKNNIIRAFEQTGYKVKFKP